jgi:hypothetical protein
MMLNSFRYFTCPTQMVSLGKILSPLKTYLLSHRVPPNLTFEFDDIEEEWLYGSGTFDLVHVRNMLMAIRDWPALTAQAFK